MDFQNNSAGLDRLLSEHTAFVGRDNPFSKFVPVRVPIDTFQQAPQLTKDALGADALDEVAGVMGGEKGAAVISLFTGNSPGAVDRAAFLADLLSNFPTFYAWMKAYLDVRENGYMITPSSETGEYLAIGPGFLSMEESAFAIHADPVEAFRLLGLKLANESVLHSDWDGEKRQFARDVEWTYVRSHPDTPGVAIVPDDSQELIVTGRWTKPGTRLAVQFPTRVPLLTEMDSDAMVSAKQEVVERMFTERNRAGGLGQ